MSARIRLYGEAALVLVAMVGMVAATLVVPAIIGGTGGVLLAGFLGTMTGYVLAIAPLALDAIRFDLRRAGR